MSHSVKVLLYGWFIIIKAKKKTSWQKNENLEIYYCLPKFLKWIKLCHQESRVPAFLTQEIAENT